MLTSAVTLVTTTAVSTLSGNVTLTVSSKIRQLLNPNGTDRNVTLPLSPSFGLCFEIFNTGSLGVLILRDGNGSLLNCCGSDQFIKVLFDGSIWKIINAIC